MRGAVLLAKTGGRGLTTVSQPKWRVALGILSDKVALRFLAADAGWNAKFWSAVMILHTARFGRHRLFPWS